MEAVVWLHLPPKKNLTLRKLYKEEEKTNLKDFLQNNSLKTKEINIDGIDERITIEQLSILKQYELVKNHKIELKKIVKMVMMLMKSI